MTTLRSPICCVLGHVDVGKTQFLDKLRHTSIQMKEAGGITQHIKSTYFSLSQLLKLGNFKKKNINIPGLLFIDTPGHDCFDSLRIRGADICDIAIVLVDVIKGLEKQTINCIQLLKAKKKPFIVVLNKLDRVSSWTPTNKMQTLKDSFSKQSKQTIKDVDAYANNIICQLAVQEINGILYYKNKDPKSYVSIVPISAKSGEGIPDLLMLVAQLANKFMKKKLVLHASAAGYVMEMNKHKHMGRLFNIILTDGTLKEKDKLLFRDGQCCEVKHIFLPPDGNELGDKHNLKNVLEITASKGAQLKITNDNKIIAGTEFIKFTPDTDVDSFTKVPDYLNEKIYDNTGIFIHAESSGTLDALWTLFKDNNTNIAGMEIGSISKQTILKAHRIYDNVSKQHPKGDTLYYKRFAVIIAYGKSFVPDKNIKKEIINHNVHIISGEVVYQLIKDYNTYVEKLDEGIRLMYPSLTPVCELKIIKEHVYLKSNPFLFGVKVTKNKFTIGTMFKTNNIILGRVIGIEKNGKPIKEVVENEEVCVKIERISKDHEYVYGVDFSDTDILTTHYDVNDIDAFERYPNTFQQKD